MNLVSTSVSKESRKKALRVKRGENYTMNWNKAPEFTLTGFAKRINSHLTGFCPLAKGKVNETV